MHKIVHHFFLYACLLALLVWILGFCAFVLYTLSFKLVPETPTEAIVVLTGGTDRIDTAVELLKERPMNYLLISGVNKMVSTEDLFKKTDPKLLEKITLGYMAENTQENALETGAWIQSKKIKSVLLVTSFYHMPRSIFEVLDKNPGLVIVPHPVFPKSFNNSVDWIRTRYAWLLFLEYHKFLFVHFKRLFLERT